MKPNGITIRTAAPRDAAALLAIYAPYVEKTAITFEYDVPSPQEFEGRIARTLRRYPYLVAEAGGRPAGYAYAGPFQERAAYGWAAEASVYVRWDARWQGIGKALYRALERCLAAQGILNLNACIACPTGEDPYLDRNSIGFHRHMGYRLVGEFRQCGCKFGRWYNMAWMEKHIGAHPADPPMPRAFPEVCPPELLR